MTDEELQKALEKEALTLNETGEVSSSGALYSSAIIAKLFCVDQRHIQQLTKDGVLPAIEAPNGRRYDLVPTVQSYIRHLRERASGRCHSGTESELKKQKLRAEIALKESQGELHRIKTDIASGKYISVEEVTLDYTRFFVVFKRFAMSLPARLVDMISGQLDPVEARQIERELQQETNSLLRAFTVAGVENGEKST